MKKQTATKKALQKNGTGRPKGPEGAERREATAAKKPSAVKPAKRETPADWEARFILAIVEITEKDLVLKTVEDMLEPCSKKDVRYIKGHPSYMTAKSNRSEAIRDAIKATLNLNGGSMEQDLLLRVIDLACRVCETTKSLAGFRGRFLLPHQPVPLGGSEG